jgi:ribosome biogenesis GTPase / thiamine phosphate phosphatase
MLTSLDPNSTSLPTGEGRVFKKSQGVYFVRADSRTISCAISSRLRKQLVYPEAAPTSRHHRVQAVKDIAEVDPVAVGDYVRFLEAGDGSALIQGVLPRRNRLARLAAGPKPLEQVIAANVDQVVAILAAADPAPKWELLDRYLAAAEAAEIPALVCITKMDLVESDEIASELDGYRRIGYPVITSSAASGQGLTELRADLRGRFSVLVGKSGVGKTSLLNALQPGLGLRVNDVNQATGKGKHTTTHLEMFELEGGGQVADTPGMREFGLWGLEGADRAYGFREILPYLGQCKFGADCEHAGEPGCAVKAAVAAGAIAERRYRSYLRMRAD